MKNIIFYYLISILVAACGDKVKQDVIQIKKSTINDLKSALGQPKRIDVDPKDNSKKIHVYSEENKYQTENDVVTAKYRAPEGEEKKLLYWKHFCKDHHFKLNSIPKKEKDHSLEKLEGNCKEKGITIIYDQDLDQVSRVVEYESH